MTIAEKLRRMKSSPMFHGAVFGALVAPKTIRTARKFDITVHELRIARPDLTREYIKKRIREICAASLYPTETVLSRITAHDL